MAKKPVITNVDSGFSSQSALNANFQSLQNAFDNTLSLDGSVPNAMQADLDINGNSVINAGIVETDTLILNGVPLTPSNAAGAALTSLTAFGGSLIDDEDSTEALGTLGLPTELQGVTATAAELNTLDGFTGTTAELNTLDGITATTAELNTLDGITATVTELNHTDGVTSNIQTQIDGKYTPATQSTGTWEAGTSTTESLVSPAKVKAAIQDLSPSPAMNIIGYASTSAVNTNPVQTRFQFGFSNIARTSTGQYTFTFSTPRSGMNYIVLAQSTGGTISRTAAINNHSTTGFDVDVRVISSGGTTDQTFDIIVFERT